mmetsp:Transcript_9525/g.10687  ORF Transcript_9525/g.10687 Transcript_9525/m.10687 type:complete len:81 (-) Transcript_9525:35-277(-)
MAFPNSYKLKVTASTALVTSATNVQWVDIHIVKSDISVFIHGGDRSLPTDRNNTFIAIVNPVSSNIVYRWLCIDASSKTF